MATVTLRKHGPRRINTKGILFVREVPVENVPRDIAEQLDADERFIVKFTAGDSVAPEREEAIEAQEDENTGETGKRIKPKNAAERYAAINDAADQLDLDNDAHFTKDGKPDARALSSILGWVVTSADRDAALKTVAPPSDTPVKVSSNVTIRRRAEQAPATDELADTGAKAAEEAQQDEPADEEPNDPSTEGSIEV